MKVLNVPYRQKDYFLPIFDNTLDYVLAKLTGPAILAIADEGRISCYSIDCNHIDTIAIDAWIWCTWTPFTLGTSITSRTIALSIVSTGPSIHTCTLIWWWSRATLTNAFDGAICAAFIEVGVE